MSTRTHLKSTAGTLGAELRVRTAVRAFRAPPERPDVDDLAAQPGVTQLVLAEYAAVRAEIQTAISNQQSALSVGAATLGLLAGVGAHFWDVDQTLSGLVFALAVPAACAMAIRMWFGELLRITRASRFIADLERWANRGEQQRVLVWEAWMSECRAQPGQDIDDATWRSVRLGFNALAVMSIALGLYALMAGGLWLVGAVAALDALLGWRARRQMQRLRAQVETYIGDPVDDAHEPPALTLTSRTA
ncbi:MAG TPA: hypothetical protein VI318_02195 [Baekduia sp.]